MGKLLLSILLCLCSSVFYAQEASQTHPQIVLKAGTTVQLQAINTTRATEVKRGQKVSFRVSRDVNVKGVTAIPYGTIAQGTVYEAKRSSWWGTKGRLGISINEIVMPDGTVVPLQNGDVYVTGENRTALSVITFLFVWPCCFICGSRAELPHGYKIQANVATNTTLTITGY